MRLVYVSILAGLSLAISASGDDFAPFTSEASIRGINYLVASYGSGPGVLGSGLCAADLDGDGNTDIVAMGKASGIIGVWRNSGAGVFVQQPSTIAPLAAGSSVAAGDFDGDGDLDLAFSQMGGPPRLCRQDAPFQFTDVTAQAGLVGDHAGRSIAWTDFDGDGRIDLLMACYSGYLTALPASTTRLWRNQGDGTFQDVTVAVGLGAWMRTFVATPVDFDNDGDADLYMSNDRGWLTPNPTGNHLYRNDGGVFTDISQGCGAALAYDSMGVAVGDLDENGLMDLLTTNLASDTLPTGAIHPLYMAMSAGVFAESSLAWGIAPVIAGETAWAVHLFDADNDGRLDVFFNNQTTPDRFFHHQAAGPMLEISLAAGLQGSSGTSFCSVIADFDNDGGIDILSNHAGTNLRLMMNQEATKRAWLKLRVAGNGRNRNAIGARMIVHANGHAIARQVFAGGVGYLGMSDSIMHVGCGTAASASVQAWWPNSSVTRTVTNLPTSKMWTIYPPSAIGDGDFDGDRDAQDLARFDNCAAQLFSPGCEIFDYDGNSVLNQIDRDLLINQINAQACDLNHDGVVNGQDLSTLLGAWGSWGPADIDHSGVVDAADLTMMLGAWG